MKISKEVQYLSVAAFYFFCSTSMNFLNKIIINSYSFNYPFFIMTCQMIVTISILDLLRIGRFISLESYNLEEGKEFFWPSTCFALHSTLSLVALHGMNIPMYGAVKRCTPLVNLILSVVVLKKGWPSTALVSSILLITVGCVVATLGDLEFDVRSYVTGSLSVLAQGLYLTLVQRSSERQVSTTRMIHLNGHNTLPFYLLASVCVGEIDEIVTSFSRLERGFVPSFVALTLSGFVLTFSQFLCASLCSALTTSLITALKSVVQTVVGFFTFGGVPFHPLNVLGLAMNVSGGIIYGVIKHIEVTRKMQKSKSHVSLEESKPLVESELKADKS